MTTQLGVLIALLLGFCCVLADDRPAAQDLFQVLVSNWTSCSRINASQACYRTREAVCVRKSDNASAPMYYCNATAAATVEACPRCAQNCAVSEWGEWSACNCSVDLYRNRTRRVISPQRNGGLPCPGLLELLICSCAGEHPFDIQPRRHTWRTGPWMACTVLDTSSVCGNGLRSRSVECVGTNGMVVEPEVCQQEPAYSSLHPPSPKMLCEVPCPCTLGEWGNYSVCTPICSARPLKGEQTRARPILQPPTLSESCSAISESRPCTVTADACPVYVWETSGWSSCMFQTGATCGAGHMTQYVYCIQVQNGVRSVVEDSNCLNSAENDSKPASIQSCQVDCPQSCHVGEWSDWSDCPRVCEEAVYSNRTRWVIGEGEMCHTMELRSCPRLPCARWELADIFGGCVIQNDGSCGDGVETRPLLCLDVNGLELPLRDCSSYPAPSHVTPCFVPCPEDCVASEWSEWSLCSATCGGPSNQTRTRHLAAYGANCPYTDANFTETRQCDVVCDLTLYYIHEEPWSACMEDPVESSGDGVILPSGAGSGIRTKERSCVRNELVIPASECPITFQQVQVESCDLPVECVVSDWTPYSACSASCGTGTKTRTRQLLQFPTSDLSSCAVSGLEGDGLIVQSTSCEVQACLVGGVDWYETAWSSCTPYSGSCGLGFQTRNVDCETGTGEVVPEARCYDAIGPRPSTISGCHLECPDRCLVTEWSEFTVCEFGANAESRREVVPMSGCSDFRDCCPELSSINTSQSVPCPAFQPDDYNFVQASPFGRCIIEPPATCGNGLRHRNIVCINLRARDRGVNLVVDNSFCIMAGRMSLSLTEPCRIRCQRSCVQSQWSPWGPCITTSCGAGHRTRTRTAIIPGTEEGRSCGPLVERDICMDGVLCPYAAEVTPGPFGPCVLTNSSSLCGPGQRTREPVCFINGEAREYQACVALGVVASFNLTESCVAQCPGECIVGEWGPWSSCNIGCCSSVCGGSCQRVRDRAILREGSQGCTANMQEFQNCDFTLPYHWVVQNWTDYIIVDTVGTSRGHYCGEGVRSRIVQCVEIASGDVVSKHRCTDAGLATPTSREHRSIPCPFDCVVGGFSDWSECEPCEFNSEQHRVRPAIMNTFGGEECPDLMQTRPCPANCTNFEPVNHTLVAKDYTVDSQCGSVLLRHSVSCRRNVMFLPPSECRVGPHETYMNLPCPREPNCTFGEWSDWSECVSLCHTPRDWFSFRTRELLSYLPGFDVACEAQQQEQRSCVSGGIDLTECVDFTWQVSEWNQDGRNVYCLANNVTQVDNSGCHSAIMPRSRNMTCVDPCPDHATCNNEEGICAVTCDAFSDKVQGACLPRVGCFNDAHCLLQNMRCNSEQCQCLEGYGKIHSNSYCDLLGVTTTAATTTVATGNNSTSGFTVSTVATTVAATVATSNPTSVTTVMVKASDGLGVIPLALIGAVPLAIFIIILILLILIMCWCRRKLDKKDSSTEMNRRRNKAPSISAPSPLPQTEGEMMYRVRGDSGSSGFVEGIDADLRKYGMAATTFSGPRSDGHIDEPLPEQREYILQGHRRVAVHPIPIAAPVPPSRNHSLHRDYDGEGHGGVESRPSSLDHSLRSSDQIPRRYQLPHLTDFPDGGMTTDMTYTTDEDTVGTTSFPPSSAASPNVSRRLPPPHMYPIEPSYDYSHSNNNGSLDSSGRGHVLVPASECHNDHGHHSSHDRVHDNHVPSNHNRNYDHFLGNHGSVAASSENPYVSMQRMSPVYAKVRRDRYRSASPPPSNGPGHYIRNESPRRMAMYPGEKDKRLTTGLDSSMLRAVNQLERNSPTSVHSSQSHSRRRSGRRRRHHARAPRYHHHGEGRYHYDVYNHSDTHLRSDGQYSSDHYASTSDAEYPCRSEPRTPTHGLPPPPTEYESRTLPHPRVHFSKSDPHPQHHYEWQAREFYPGDGDYRSPTHRDSSSKWYQGEEHESRSRERGGYYVEHYPSKSDSQRRHDSPQRRHDSPQRRHGSPQRHHGSPQRRHGSPQRHHASSQRHSPPPSPRDPPNFVPPVPPHAISPGGSGFDDYDYPSRFQPHQLVKLREEMEREGKSPYARPRPLNSPGSKEQVGGGSRISSPYDYPKIRSAGSGASRTHPYSPSVTSDPSTSFSNALTSHSSPQISRVADQGSSLTPQGTPRNRHSNPGLPRHLETTSNEIVSPQSSNFSTPQPTTSAPQPTTSTPQLNTSAPQPTTSAPQPSNSVSQTGTYLGLDFASYSSEQTTPTSQPTRVAPQSGTMTPQSHTSTPQPHTSTPQPHTSPPRRIPNLTIQISPVSDHGDSSNPGSPYLSRKHHPPSPLVLHSSVSDESPRTSGEVDALVTPHTSYSTGLGVPIQTAQ